RAAGEAGCEEDRVREALVGDGGAERAAVLRGEDAPPGEGGAAQRVAVGRAAPHPPLRGTFSPLAGRRESEPLIRRFAPPSPAGGEKGRPRGYLRKSRRRTKTAMVRASR